MTITAAEKLEKQIEADRKINEDTDIQKLLKKEKERILRAEMEQRRFSSTFGFENIHQLQDSNDVDFEKIADIIEDKIEEDEDNDDEQKTNEDGSAGKKEEAPSTEKQTDEFESTPIPLDQFLEVEEATKVLEEIANEDANQAAAEETKKKEDAYSDSDDDFQRVEKSGCGSCCSVLKQILIWFFMDIVFMAFMAT
eukprot:CAMPEP_0170511846 /NCGR_PEP_ID=MMETSP0208-20121228/66525_1 /TAXON_ID=197538 /ORGANISM="Strombidium inclinatum, Strain S3" /LENGTH=195 /DNA_ID=CAMNT_0010795417 /DNA_START=1015 /DNA_END=1602 /DNA_ORIENTATION=+